MSADEEITEKQSKDYNYLVGSTRVGNVNPYLYFLLGRLYLSMDSIEQAMHQYDLMKYKDAFQSTRLRFFLMKHPNIPELLYPDFPYSDGLKKILPCLVRTYTHGIKYVSYRTPTEKRIQDFGILDWGIIIDDHSSFITSGKNISEIIEARLEAINYEPENEEYIKWKVNDYIGEYKDTRSKYINHEYIIFSSDLDADACEPPSIKYDGFNIGDSVFILQNPFSYSSILTMASIVNIGEDPMMGIILALDPDSSLDQEIGLTATPEGELIGPVIIPQTSRDKIVYAFTLEGISKYNPIERLSVNQFANQYDSIQAYHKQHEGLYRLYREGQGYVWNSDYEAAMKSFSGIIAKDSSYARAHLYLGFCYNKLGDTTNAIQHFKKACAFDHNLVEAPFQLGMMYLSNGDLEKAAEVFEECSKINGNNPYPLYMLAKTYESLGKKRLVKKYRRLLWTVDKDLAEQLE